MSRSATLKDKNGGSTWALSNLELEVNCSLLSEVKWVEPLVFNWGIYLFIPASAHDKTLELHWHIILTWFWALKWLKFVALLPYTRTHWSDVLSVQWVVIVAVKYPFVSPGVLWWTLHGWRKGCRDLFHEMVRWYSNACYGLEGMILPAKGLCKARRAHIALA